MSKSKKGMLFVLMAVLGALGLIVPTAMAGSTGAVADDWGNNTAPWTGPTPASMGGCDTIDPVLTVNRTRVAYKCIGNPLTVHNRLADLSTATFSTSGSTINLQWVTNGPIPVPGSTDVFQGGSGFSFGFWFQNATRQNARQQVGDTIDCTRYGHMGPYLTGNGEYLNLFANIFFNADSASWETELGFGHLDPVGNNNWAFLADGAGVMTSSCSGGVRSAPTPTFVGTGMTASVSGNTLNVSLPMVFQWSDNQAVPHSYTLMQPGDLITSISATTAATVDAATTPEIPPGCTGASCLQSPQGVSNQFLLDWQPWNSYDLGLVPSQGPAISGPRCPSFGAMEYQPGGGKNSTGGTYLPLAKGPSGQDRDTQVNPLFANGLPGINGTSHYDSSQAAGNTTNDLVFQNHLGPTKCVADIPEAAHLTGAGYSITA